MNFCPLASPAEGGQWGGSVYAIPLARGRQNRKIFVSFTLLNNLLRKLKSKGFYWEFLIPRPLAFGYELRPNGGGVIH
ncbi:hypothetical protein KKB41_04220 [Patescibacteria group bacterium]|nr:hypothetical protein [Patescibacteria group bacterium]